jgi:hypothetical protein
LEAVSTDIQAECPLPGAWIDRPAA